MKLLDLFCGAGGAAMGYHRAGFDEIVGVDHRPQPHYPFTFVRADALSYLAEHGRGYDLIHASPPCQAYSVMRNLPWLRDRPHAALVLPTRNLLRQLGCPWVIENVYSARRGSTQLAKLGLEEHGMQSGWLCGTMFGLRFYRHRLFEASFLWLQPTHERHRVRIRSRHALGSRARDITWVARRNGALAEWQRGGNRAQCPGVGVGHAANWRAAATEMGIDWMNQNELTQAVPPCFTEFIGCAFCG